MNLVAQHSRACLRAALAPVRHLAPHTPWRHRSLPLVMVLTLVAPAVALAARGTASRAAAPVSPSPMASASATAVPLPADFVPDEMLVAYRPGVSPAEADAVERTLSTTRIKWQPTLRYAKLRLPAGTSD